MSDALGRHAYAVDAGWTRPRRAARLACRLRLRSLAADTLCRLLGRHRSDPRRHRAQPGAVRRRAPSVSPRSLHRDAAAGFDAQTDTVGCTRLPPPAERGSPAGSPLAARGMAARQPPALRLLDQSRGGVRGRGGWGNQPDRARIRCRRRRRGVRHPRATSVSFGRHVVLAGRLAAAAGWGAIGGRRVFSARRLRSVGAGLRLRARHHRARARHRRGRPRGHARGGRQPRPALPDRAHPARRGRRGRFFSAPSTAPSSPTPGNAWDSSFHAADVRTSAGAELSIDVGPRSLLAGDAGLGRRLDARSRRRPQPRCSFARIGTPSSHGVHGSNRFGP